MLNIASGFWFDLGHVYKVLIIKTFKSKSPAEVADIFNVSKWQVERMRLATSMTDPGQADRARAFWSDCQKSGLCQPPHSSRRSGLLFCQELYVGFLLAKVSTVVLLPRNQC